MKRSMMALSLFVALGACNSADSAVSEAANDSNATVSTAEPTKLPGELPAYPNAQPGSTVNVSGAANGAHAQAVMFRTADDAAKILDFYSKAAGELGMKQLSRNAMGTTSTLSLMKGSEAIAVTATAAGGVTQVQVGSASR